MSYLLPHAGIDWQDNTPASTTYDDIYWHRGAALEEKQYVFIEPLKALAARMEGRSQITVCELGFGFGINCLLAAAFWASRPTDQRLNLVSIEKHPVEPASLRHYLEQHELPHADALLSQYPPPYQGQHVIWLAENIRLLLIFDDVDSALADLDVKADLWFLDGFAPARNQDMWADTLFPRIFSRSRPGALLATYSASGQVRRGLESNGFTVEKREGFGRKKEMLSARKPGNWQPGVHGSGSFAIVGAGLAGLFCAEAFQRRGIAFTLVDNGHPAASHIPQLAMFPQLAVRAEARYRFSLNASRYMQSSPGYHASGLTWTGRSADERERLNRISALFPAPLIRQVGDGIVHYAQAGWVSLEDLIAALQIAVTRSEVSRLTREEHTWLCHEQEKLVAAADHVILATGAGRSLLPDQLQIRAIRGQAISIRTEPVDTVLNGQVTIFPTRAGHSVVSGTYSQSAGMAVDESESQHLLAQAGRVLGESAQLADAHVGIRAVSRDRLPIVGQMPDWGALKFVNRVSAVHEFQAGLYLCTAFGSRGATHARLCAEHLVSQMLGEPAALGLKHQQMLSPARFTIRDANASR
jgi:tRNA 5-methylaminomethyl-2-thiouridine biosynthesis bifunctional protein